MTVEKSSRLKTQTLSLRLDPKTRFILEFISRVRGQNITVVVERAIKEAADKAGIGPTHDGRNNEVTQATWVDFWDPDDGVRTLKLLINPDYSTTYEEDEIRLFTLDHWEFFYTSSNGLTVARNYTSLLWPKLENYMETWRAKRTQEYWAVGKLMADYLSLAGVAPPQWPRKLVEKPKQSFTRDLDDEVPF